MTALSPTLPETEAPVRAPTRSIDDVLFAVHVMDEDIELGVRGKADQCPIRRAAWRQLVLAGFKPFRGGVGWNFAEFMVNGQMQRFEHSGRRFIEAFDNRLPVEPCVVNFTRRSTH